MMNDKDIVELFWERDEGAIVECRGRYGAYLTRVVMNILGCLEDCEECVNDTYLAAWRSIPPNRPQQLLPYLAKISRRIAIDRIRRMNREKRRDTEYWQLLSELSEVAYEDSTAEQVEAQVLAETVNTFLYTLPITDRTVFIRRYYYMEPIGTIARNVGMREAGVKTMLFRLRGRLREYLRKEGYKL